MKGAEYKIQHDGNYYRAYRRGRFFGWRPMPTVEASTVMSSVIASLLFRLRADPPRYFDATGKEITDATD